MSRLCGENELTETEGKWMDDLQDYWTACYENVLTADRKSVHTVDSVIESSFREITLCKNFALINLSLNFCEMTIYDNKVFLENLVAVH